MAIEKKPADMTEEELYAELNARDTLRMQLGAEMKQLRGEIAFRSNAPAKLKALEGISDADLERLKKMRDAAKSDAPATSSEEPAKTPSDTAA